MVTSNAIRAAHAQPTKPKRAASRRWLILLAVSFLLHILLINWGSNKIGIPQPASPQPTIVTAELKPLPPVAKPVLIPKPNKPALVARKEPRKIAAPPPPPEPEVLDTPIRETRTPITPITPTDTVTSLDSDSDKPPQTTTSSTNTTALPENAPVAPTGVHYETKPPPSVELKYSVEALKKGQTFHGSGKITWQTDGHNYTINGEAGALFISALDFKSEGEINDFGVSPALYTEKKFRKPATNTRFQRTPSTITFSASANSYPRTGGEQDRASIVWQLASIARGDAGKIVPGGVIDLFVAGDKDAETWRFQVVGQEQITVGAGTVATWHLARKPQQGSYEKTLDIWFAPQQQWYPVKLRFTESDGDYLDMSLSKLKQLDAPATPG
ncbi:DUF3108 domain-containing protein [Glaciimonas sp. PCH181]|uniref:DUF3108 domain-containing protein n=1 Tax=Glaciimonas sp. PCH181 TaxID=2133943 RepID=UPI000D35774E|nr:DUF3108 domain-containing protein [Glaciimonas sp. PCH181]PUA18216.1 DUF3108 domain-containing protein [Glaciimonas sp. PCH181]